MPKVRGEIIKETAAAIHVRQQGRTITSPSGKSMALPVTDWVAKSQMSRISRGPDPEEGKLRSIEFIIPQWLFDKLPFKEVME